MDSGRFSNDRAEFCYTIDQRPHLQCTSLSDRAHLQCQQTGPGTANRDSICSKLVKALAISKSVAHSFLPMTDANNSDYYSESHIAGSHFYCILCCL